MRPRNWCGTTKTRMLAPLAASTASGTAMRLWGSSCPGRYLTFSWVLFMMSVNFWPPTSSSWTQIFTFFVKSGSLCTFFAMIRAMAEPQFPEPMTDTRMALEQRTCGTAMAVRLSGGSLRTTMQCTLRRKGNSKPRWCARMYLATTSTVRTPLGRSPLQRNSLASSSQDLLGSFAKDSAQRRLRDSPKVEAMRSVQPQAPRSASSEECVG
mmetsp:Transcript_16172/g.48567  ORF Transcript_16172/g.48567 Transcript_16172/m.48567 type:complete len:210 (-) Transcript_16172:1696-2325(-)